MTPIRIRKTYGGTTVTLWTGFVSGFPQSYDPPYDATVMVTASDGFSVLQRTKMPSLYAFEVAADTPSLWWRFGEQAGTAAVDSSTGGHDGTFDGGATASSRASLIDDSNTSIYFGTGMSAFAPFTLPAPPNLTFECWCVYATAHSDTIIWSYNVGDTLSAHAFVSLNAAGRVIVSYFNDLSNRTSVTGTRTIVDGLPHHIVVVFDTTNTAIGPKVYIDGTADATTVSGPLGTLSALGAAMNYAAAYPGYTAVTFTTDTTLDEFAIYPTALSAARVLVHYNAGYAPYTALDTGAAVTKVLDIIGWPVADRTIETGKSTVVAFDTSDRTALEVLQSLEATEQGRFFIAPDGKATFYNRHHTLTTAASLTSQATFGDSGGELPYGDLSLDYDETKIRNSVTTARVNGGPIIAKDTTSITSYREREYSLTGLLNSSDGELRDLGLWILGHYAQPATRVPQIVIQPRAAPSSLFPQIRDRLLCDQITVKRRPQNVGTAISLAVLVEGVQHDITPDDWTARLLLSPAETTGVFILDSATLGLLDTDRLSF
jgi:hypothetical protein